MSNRLISFSQGSAFWDSDHRRQRPLPVKTFLRFQLWSSDLFPRTANSLASLPHPKLASLKLRIQCILQLLQQAELLQGWFAVSPMQQFAVSCLILQTMTTALCCCKRLLVQRCFFLFSIVARLEHRHSSANTLILEQAESTQASLQFQPKWLWPFFNSYPRDLDSFLLIYMASPLWDFPHVPFPSSSGEWVWEVPLEWVWEVQSAMNGSNSGSHLGKYVGCGSRPLFQLWLGRNTLFCPLWPLVWHVAQIVNKYLLN